MLLAVPGLFLLCLNGLWIAVLLERSARAIATCSNSSEYPPDINVPDANSLDARATKGPHDDIC